MPVLVEGISVLIRRDAIVSCLPGGWDEFLTLVPNATLCFDDGLARVGFMASTDGARFIDLLRDRGLIYLDAEGTPTDLVVADQVNGLLKVCSWVEVFKAVHFESEANVMAARLLGSTSCEIATPSGWDYHKSLSKDFKFVPAGQEPSSHVLLKQENERDVYLDLTTGKESFVGRTRPDAVPERASEARPPIPEPKPLSADTPPAGPASRPPANELLDYLAPDRLKSIALLWAVGGFVLIGSGILSGTAIPLAFGPPAILWAVAWLGYRFLPLTPEEGRRLIASFGKLLSEHLSVGGGQPALPSSLARLKEAYAVMIPVAVAEGNLNYLGALRASYPMLASYGDSKGGRLATSLQLQDEFDRLAGLQSSISMQAENLRTAAEALRAKLPHQDVDGVLRTISEAELEATKAEEMGGGERPNLLLDLASSKKPAQLRAVKRTMTWAKAQQPAELSLDERITAVLATEWQELKGEREIVVKALARTMGDPETDVLVVNILAHALATAGEDGLTELLELLGHDTFWIRTYAAHGLGTLNNRARWAVPSLARALEDCQSDWTAFTIIRALGHIGGGEASTLLEGLATLARSRTPPDAPLLEALEYALAAIRTNS